MESGNCCDMNGCIALFEAIDPLVKQIETFAGAKCDTTYVRREKGWRPIGGDGSLWPAVPEQVTW